MSNMICVEKSKPSSLKRLKFLPRVGLVIDFAGQEITYRQAPLLETLVNLRKRGFSMKNLMEVALTQFSEINLKKHSGVPEVRGSKKRKAKK